MNDSASVLPHPPTRAAGGDLADANRGPHLGWVYGLPIVAAILVFAQILTAGWVYDDISLIEINPRMEEWSTILFTFQNPFWDITPVQVNYTGFYRPIGGTMFVLLYKISGGSPLVFHLASLLFHAACTFLVVRLALLLNLPRMAALVAGAYFAISGSHVEAVAWASSLPDLLATFFSLLAVIGFFRLQLVRPAIWLTLAVLSKEAALATWLFLVAATLFAMPKIPGMVAALAPSNKGAGTNPDASASAQPLPRRLPRFAMLFAVALVVWLLRWQAFDSLAAGFDKQLTYHHLSPIHQMMVSLGLIAEYIAYFAWPWPNFPFRPLQVDLTPSDFALWGPAAAGLLLLLASAVVWLWRNRRSGLVLVGFGLMFAGLAPVLNTKVIGRFPFEQRFLYLPSVGFALLSGFAVLWLGRRLPKAIVAIPLLAVAASNVWSAVVATPNWKDEMSFFTWTRTESPNAMTPYLNLARLYLTQAETFPPGHPQRMKWAEKAFDEYEASLKVDSKKWLVVSIERENGNFGMGQALYSMGDLGTAEAVYRETLKGYPNSQHAHLGIAQCLLDRAERSRMQQSQMQVLPLYEEALRHARQATQGMMELEGAYECLSIAQQFLGRPEDALASAERALALKPDSENLATRKIEVLWALNRQDLMKQTALEFLERKPDSPMRAEFEGMIQMIDAGQWPVMRESAPR